jgi:hypothetical protein
MVIERAGWRGIAALHRSIEADGAHAGWFGTDVIVLGTNHATRAGVVASLGVAAAAGDSGKPVPPPKKSNASTPKSAAAAAATAAAAGPPSGPGAPPAASAAVVISTIAGPNGPMRVHNFADAATPVLRQIFLASAPDHTVFLVLWHPATRVDKVPKEDTHCSECGKVVAGADECKDPLDAAVVAHDAGPGASPVHRRCLLQEGIGEWLTQLFLRCPGARVVVSGVTVDTEEASFVDAFVAESLARMSSIALSTVEAISTEIEYYSDPIEIASMRNAMAAARRNAIGLRVRGVGGSSSATSPVLAALRDHAAELEPLAVRVPRTFAAVAETLATQDRPFLTWPQFVAVCADHGVHGLLECECCALFLHSAARVQCFELATAAGGSSNAGTLAGRRIYVDRTWFADVVCAVLAATPLPLQQPRQPSAQTPTQVVAGSTLDSNDNNDDDNDDNDDEDDEDDEDDSDNEEDASAAPPVVVVVANPYPHPAEKLLYRRVAALRLRGVLPHHFLSELSGGVLSPQDADAMAGLLASLGLLLRDADSEETSIVPSMLYSPPPPGPGVCGYICLFVFDCLFDSFVPFSLKNHFVHNTQSPAVPYSKPAEIRSRPQHRYGLRVIYPFLPSEFLLRCVAQHDAPGTRVTVVSEDTVILAVAGRETVLEVRSGVDLRDYMRKIGPGAAGASAVTGGAETHLHDPSLGDETLLGLRSHVVIWCSTPEDLSAMRASVSATEWLFPGIASIGKVMRCPGRTCRGRERATFVAFDESSMNRPGGTLRCRFCGDADKDFAVPCWRATKPQVGIFASEVGATSRYQDELIEALGKRRLVVRKYIDTRPAGGGHAGKTKDSSGGGADGAGGATAAAPPANGDGSTTATAAATTTTTTTTATATDDTGTGAASGTGTGAATGSAAVPSDPSQLPLVGVSIVTTVDHRDHPMHDDLVALRSRKENPFFFIPVPVKTADFPEMKSSKYGVSSLFVKFESAGALKTIGSEIAEKVATRMAAAAAAADRAEVAEVAGQEPAAADGKDNAPEQPCKDAGTSKLPSHGSGDREAGRDISAARPGKDPARTIRCPLCLAAGSADDAAHLFDRDVCISLWRDNIPTVPCDLGRKLRTGPHRDVSLATVLTPQVFLSYCWATYATYATQPLVRDAFKPRVESDGDGLMCWFDEERMRPGITLNEAMEEGVRDCTVMVLFLDERYLTRVNCRTELIAALTRGKVVVPVLMPQYNDERIEYVRDAPGAPRRLIWWPRSEDGIEIVPADSTDTRVVPYERLAAFEPIRLRDASDKDKVIACAEAVATRVRGILDGTYTFSAPSATPQPAGSNKTTEALAPAPAPVKTATQPAGNSKTAEASAEHGDASSETAQSTEAPKDSKGSRTCAIQ